MKWRIEEASTGSTSDAGLIVVYPDMIVDDPRVANPVVSAKRCIPTQ